MADALALPALAAVAYAILAHALLARWGATDNERWYLGLDWAVEAARYRAERGRPVPARLPYRLSLEHALWAWAHDLRTGRLLGCLLGMAVTAGAVGWAQAVGGPRAALVTALVLLTNRQLVGILGTASYVALVAGLWLLGLAGWWYGWLPLALVAGAALIVLRTSAWGMGALLLLLGGPWGWATLAGLGAWAWGWHRDAVIANGWVQWARGQREAPRIPYDGLGYALQVAHNRYVTLAVWALAAWLLGRGHPLAWALLGFTAGCFVLLHAPRFRLRPKWVVGYLPEGGPAFAVAIGLLLR